MDVPAPTGGGVTMVTIGRCAHSLEPCLVATATGPEVGMYPKPGHMGYFSWEPGHESEKEQSLLPFQCGAAELQTKMEMKGPRASSPFFNRLPIAPRVGLL